ncbi:BnaA09g15500D [Brassica napus]|uniref:BnaA09g15500D protein n=1 Tax=Brassica napus TaxID=3708 RepID=A0A078HV67_BRANA|nr:BnaA09g15500D [Brassica napus]
MFGRAGGEKVYNVFHNQFLVALKRFQVDKQELVHKSANETVMASPYTRIKAIPIGHIRLINGDNLDTQTPMRYPQYLLVKVKGLCTYISNLKRGVFVYLKIPTLFTSVIFSSKALRTVNLRWVEKLLLLSQIRLLQCMSSEKTFPHHKVTWFSIGK